MKKIATMLAAGVVALGASAQADQVESTEYAVITIPMVRGASAYNLVGISVDPIGDNPTLATVFGGSLNSSAIVQTTSSATGKEPEQVPAVKGQAVWVKNASVENIYEIGLAPAESGVVDVDLAANPASVVTPFADAWSLADLDVQEGGTSVLAAEAVTNPRTADKVSIWNPESNTYHNYVYIKGTGWKAADRGTPSQLPTIGAGRGVFVKLCTSRKSVSSVTFKAPAAAVAP